MHLHRNRILKRISESFKDSGDKALSSILDQALWSLFSFMNLGLIYRRVSLDTVAVIALILSFGYMTSMVLKAKFVNPRFANNSQIPIIAFPKAWKVLLIIAIPTFALSLYILFFKDLREIFFQSIVLFLGIVTADLFRNVNLANQFFRVNLYSLAVLAAYLGFSWKLSSNQIIIVFGFALWLYSLISFALGSRLLHKKFHFGGIQEMSPRDVKHGQTLVLSTYLSMFFFLINNLLLIYLNPDFMGATTILNVYLAGIALMLSTALSSYLSFIQRNRNISSTILINYWLIVALILTINYIFLHYFIAFVSQSNSDYYFIMELSRGTYFLTLSISLWHFFTYFLSIHLSRQIYILVQFIVSLNFSLIPSYAYLTEGVLVYNAVLGGAFIALAICIFCLSRRIKSSFTLMH